MRHAGASTPERGTGTENARASPSPSDRPSPAETAATRSSPKKQKSRPGPKPQAGECSSEIGAPGSCCTSSDRSSTTSPACTDPGATPYWPHTRHFNRGARMMLHEVRTALRQHLRRAPIRAQHHAGRIRGLPNRGARIRTGDPLLPKHLPLRGNHGKESSKPLMGCTICLLGHDTMPESEGSQPRH